jgi:hypothetical protein
MKKIDTHEWLHHGCFIQKSEHPKLFGKYSVFKNDKNQTHVGRYATKKKAIKAAQENKCLENHYQF